MKTHVAENVEKTRRAVATGNRVVFYRRKRKAHGYSEPRQCWERVCNTHEQAAQAADRWANEIKLVRWV